MLTRACLLLSCLLLGACAPNLSPNSYDSSSVGVVAHVDQAHIVSMRAVKVDNDSGVGGMAGTAGGAVAGSAIGGGARANVIGAVGGAVVGGVVGAAVDKSIHEAKGYEYILKVNQSGKLISLVQVDRFGFRPGDQVLIIFSDRTRIVPDDVPASAAHTKSVAHA
jgi:outer membrane lipoprotein SlyB